jgi:hypothetical protein
MVPLSSPFLPFFTLPFPLLLLFSLYLFVLPYLLLSSPAPFFSYPLPLFLPLSLPPDPYFNKLLRIMSTRCMMPAEYFCSGEIDKSQVRRNMQRLHYIPHLKQLISLFNLALPASISIQLFPYIPLFVTLPPSTATSIHLYYPLPIPDPACTPPNHSPRPTLIAILTPFHPLIHSLPPSFFLFTPLPLIPLLSLPSPLLLPVASLWPRSTRVHPLHLPNQEIRRHHSAQTALSRNRSGE